MRSQQRDAELTAISTYYAELGSRKKEPKYYAGGPFEVAKRTWFITNLGGLTAFETDEGLVMVDAGTLKYGPEMAKALRKHTAAPLHTVVYTHHHPDHAHGTASFLVQGQARPRIIGQRAMPANWARYERVPRHMLMRSVRQHGDDVQNPTRPYLGFKAPEMPPDTFYDDRLTIQVGGLTFELHHARGETDDHTWVYCPERDVLCPGDLVCWSMPNCGNPQKAQRYPWDWANALREMAGTQAATLCPGHGPAVIGDKPLVRRILLETASYLDSIVEQTLAALEKDSPPHVDIVRSVKPPVTNSPWLQPLHDDPEFVARNVVRYYAGWYTGRPSELKPAARSAVAGEIAKLAGGAVQLAEKAQALADGSDLQLGCHLADYALEAAPGDLRVQEIVARLYEARATREPSRMAIGIFRSAAFYARAGRPFA